VIAIFEIGMRNASPKILMDFLPSYDSLSTEHVKSHLQKYRMRADHSDFLRFYYDHMHACFHDFLNNKGWESERCKVSPRVQTSHHETNKLIYSPTERFIDWCYLLQTVLVEHARIQHLMQLTIDELEGDSKPYEALLGVLQLRHLSQSGDIRSQVSSDITPKSFSTYVHVNCVSPVLSEDSNDTMEEDKVNPIPL